MWRLEVGLTARYQPPAQGSLSLGHIRGGPGELLRWMETQLGIAAPDTPLSHRVTQYSQALEKEKAESCYEASFDRDRWKTSEDLLHRRDELLLSGWDGTTPDNAPTILRDLARVEQALVTTPAGPAERLKSVFHAIDIGQLLPSHECILADAPESWPLRWKQVLNRLDVREAVAITPVAPEPCSLGIAQRQSLSGVSESFHPDDLWACYFVNDLLGGASGRVSSRVMPL